MENPKLSNYQKYRDTHILCSKKYREKKKLEREQIKRNEIIKKYLDSLTEKLIN